MTDADFQVACTAHKDVLFRFAWRMTGSPAVAEDLVHDSFIALLRNPAAFDRDRGTLRSFLLGITRNLALKRARRERTFRDLNDDTAVVPSIEIADRERAAIVAEAIAILPPLKRDVLILAEYEELTLDEICRAVDAEPPALPLLQQVHPEFPAQPAPDPIALMPFAGDLLHRPGTDPRAADSILQTVLILSCCVRIFGRIITSPPPAFALS